MAYPIFDLQARPLRRAPLRARSREGDDRSRGRVTASGASFLPGDPKLIGVWVDQASPARWTGDPREPGGATAAAKIGAIGVRLSRWVTMHGFAFNVSTDLSGFELIVPCGIAEYGVTSLTALGMGAPSVEEVARASVARFEHVFEASGSWTTSSVESLTAAVRLASA